MAVSVRSEFSQRQEQKRRMSATLFATTVCLYSGVVQLVAHGPLEPRILVRVQAPEPFLATYALTAVVL